MSADERDPTADDETIEDLDANEDDAEAVKGRAAGRPVRGRRMSAEERDPTTDDVQLEDLDADADEADLVTGGRLGDPCDGGE